MKQIELLKNSEVVMKARDDLAMSEVPKSFH